MFFIQFGMNCELWFQSTNQYRRMMLWCLNKNPYFFFVHTAVGADVSPIFTYRMGATMEWFCGSLSSVQLNLVLYLIGIGHTLIELSYNIPANA